jgi:hypothetical protein
MNKIRASAQNQIRFSLTGLEDILSLQQVRLNHVTVRLNSGTSPQI